MLKRILFVDDEPKILQAFERQLRKQFEIVTAAGPELGLETISQKGPFAVVVSDLRMPGMDGIEFLTRMKEAAPETVRIMLTGQADLSDAVMAVNQGNIFQLLMKPCPSEMLIRALNAALNQHCLITAERELLERTLNGSIGVLSEILSLVNPPAFGRAQRIRRYVRHMAQKLNLPDQWKYELAAMLSQIGCVSVPPVILEKFAVGQPLSPEEEQILSAQPVVGQKLLSRIPRLESVAQMVADQRLSWTDPGATSGTVKVGAHLLKVALDFDEHIAAGRSVESALAKMRAHSEYRQSFLTALAQVHVEQAQNESLRVAIEELRTHMIFDADVFARNGLLLLAKGQEVTESAIARLKSFYRTVGVIEPISVTVPRAGVPPADPGRGGPVNIVSPPSEPIPAAPI